MWFDDKCPQESGQLVDPKRTDGSRHGWVPGIDFDPLREDLFSESLAELLP